MNPTVAEASSMVGAARIVAPEERGDALVSLDIVIPIFNEEETVSQLAGRLNALFTAETCVRRKISEVTYIFVDDGSTDQSVRILIESLGDGPKYKIIRLSRNFGHQAAITAGMRRSTASLTAVMDADLQDPPELILEMVQKWREGFEVVYGLRRNRKESLLKVFLYWLFYRVYRFLSPIDVPLDSGDFCLMSRRVMEELVSLPEKFRFPRGLRSWVGFPQVGVTYDRPERAHGTSKYNWTQLYKLATDGIASLSIRPLKLAQLLSFAYFTISGFVLVFVVGKIFQDINAENIHFYILTMLILLGNGLILFCLYILGAYVGRGYLEIKDRPDYIIQEIIER